MKKRDILKEKMTPLYKKVCKLNLYVNWLNEHSEMDYDRVYNELMVIKNEVKNIEEFLNVEGTQQKLSL